MLSYGPSMVARVGMRQARGSLAGLTSLRCEAGEYLGRVVCDVQLRIVGVLILEPDSGPLPF